MKFFLLFPLVIVVSLLGAQSLSPCPIVDTLYNDLNAQAAQIILNELVAGDVAADRPIELDSQRRAEYLSLLFAVHQLEDSPERDTVIDQLNIRPFELTSTQTITLFVDPNLDWMTNLRAGNPSGNTVLDSLMDRYAMTVSNYSNILVLNSHRVRLTSTRHLNTPALAKVFRETMEDLNFSEAVSFAGDGDNIEMIPVLPTGWIVRYSDGSGDCPAGCIFRQNYDFDVEPICDEFDVRLSGGTSTRGAAISPLRIFPTPFAASIHLPENIAHYSYELFDAVGRRVKRSSSKRSGPITGLEHLVSGWYVLKVRDQAGKVYLARVIK